MGAITGWRDLVRGGGDKPARAASEAEVLQLGGLRDLFRVGARVRVRVGARVTVGVGARFRVGVGFRVRARARVGVGVGVKSWG